MIAGKALVTSSPPPPSAPRPCRHCDAPSADRACLRARRGIRAAAARRLPVGVCSTRTVRSGAAERTILHQLAGDHAGDRRADDHRDARFRVVVPRLQHARALPAGLGVSRAGIELVVWSIPLLVIMLLGGVAWIGSHELDPAKPLDSDVEPLEIQVVSLDWKWLFIYPDQRIASVNRAGRAGRRAAPLHAHLGQRDERVLRAAARQHDLHDERHDDAAASAGRRAGHVPRPFGAFQRRRLFRTCTSTCGRCRPTQFDDWVADDRRRRSDRSTTRATRS